MTFVSFRKMMFGFYDNFHRQIRPQRFVVLVISMFLMVFGHSQEQAPEPPEMTRMSTHSFADQKEVSMGDWLAYVYHTLAFDKDTAAALEALPDTTCIPGKYMTLIRKFCRHFSDYKTDKTMPIRSQRTGFDGVLLMNPETNILDRRPLLTLMDLPVVCITYDQAMDFCRWRTRSLKNIARFRSDAFEIRFRLPTLIEWEDMAATMEDPTDSTTNRGCNAFHFAVEDTCSQMNRMCSKYGPGTCAVDAYKPVGDGFYNLRGNVAEMTLTQGLAKGGSCIQPARLCLPDVNIRYTKPENWLGFRCVAFTVDIVGQE